MFRRLPKIPLMALGAFVAGMACSFMVINSYIQASTLSTAEEIQAVSNNSKELNLSRRAAIVASRTSAVNLMSVSPVGVISSLSGTYIKFDDRYYILTVAHGIIGSCDLTKIMVGEDMYDCVEYADIDYHKDYALIEVDEISELTPVNIRRSIPRNNEWDEALAIQTKTYYTGYPNGIGPFTIGGEIVGYDRSENVYLHSFAWPGSSGSGIFNESGQMIGYAMAISVGGTEYGVDVLEDIVIVVPLYKIDWNVLE